MRLTFNSKRLSDKSKVAGKLNDLSSMWKNATTQFMEQAFRGDDKSVKYIGAMMANGKFNNRQTTLDMPGLTNQIIKVFLAILIPEVWRAGAGLAPAFIMDSGYDCNAVGPLDNDYLDPSTALETGYCYKGRRYYILAPNGKAQNCENHVPPGHGGGPPCVDLLFTAPHNLWQFNSSSGWAGITKEDLIAG